MLRRCLWAVLGVLFAAGLAVPQASAQGIKLGVKGGLNIANIGGSEADSLAFLLFDADVPKKSNAGFVAGAFAEFMIGNMFAIQPEVLYSKKGVKFEESGAEVKIKVDYIEIPVLLKINIPIEGSKVHPNVYAGPAVAIKSSCKLSGSAASVSVDVDCEGQDIVDLTGFEILVKSTDFGLVFGGGVSFDVGGADVGVDVRYTLGLSTIDDDPDPYDFKNQVISIMGTVGFSR